MRWHNKVHTKPFKYLYIYIYNARITWSRAVNVFGGGRTPCVFSIPLSSRPSHSSSTLVFNFRRHVQPSDTPRRADRPATRQCDVPGGRTSAAGYRTTGRALSRARRGRRQSRGARRAETSARESIRPIHLRPIFAFFRRSSGVAVMSIAQISSFVLLLYWYCIRHTILYINRIF